MQGCKDARMQGCKEREGKGTHPVERFMNATKTTYNLDSGTQSYPFHNS